MTIHGPLTSTDVPETEENATLRPFASSAGVASDHACLLPGRDALRPLPFTTSGTAHLPLKGCCGASGPRFAAVRVTLPSNHPTPQYAPDQEKQRRRHIHKILHSFVNSLACP